MLLDRTDRSFLGHWWWTVDRYLLISIITMMAIGLMLVMAASPAVAERIGLDSFYFVRRQVIFLITSIFIMAIFSFLPQEAIKRLGIAGFIATIIILALVLVMGIEVKGARRWISILGFSLQPSEFIKPFLALVIAWVMSYKNNHKKFPGYKIAIVLYVIVAGLLVLQPDFGMTLAVTAVWAAQLFLAGLPLIWIAGLAIFGIGGLVVGYFQLPHVRNRIDTFLDPAAGDNYQVSKSLEAIANGGLLGVGPGEGTVKSVIPDSHTDFIFAVAGEELGIIASLLIVALYAFIIVRGFYRIWQETNFFKIYAIFGLLVLFGIQTIVNMGVTLGLLPNTGMTLPFISYGGSATLSTAISMGIILALTRRKYGTH